ncbi:MAG: DUF1559 domain-containing protein [Planctomycetaceae bacterium]
MIHSKQTIDTTGFRSGFTVVELLVTITIITILLALLMPAVQTTRESARRVQCSNNLRQLSLAAIRHEETFGWYPTGGWSRRWAGLPDRGAGIHQPGGWVYNVLPFLEQHSLHQLGGSDDTSTTQVMENSQRLTITLSLLNCPTRRGQDLYPNFRGYFHTALVDQVARNDYAFNGGHLYTAYGNGPDSLADEETWAWPDFSTSSGLSFQRSKIRQRDVTDGTSNTYLIAEKHLRRDHYVDGMDLGDNECMYSGDDRDLTRYTGTEFDTTFRPLPDSKASPQEGLVFGSAHDQGFQAALSDGSVRFVQYDISQQIHSRLGNRHDGKPVEF